MCDPFISSVKLHDFNKNTEIFPNCYFYLRIRFIMHSLHFNWTVFSFFFFLPLIVTAAVADAAASAANAALLTKRNIFFFVCILHQIKFMCDNTDTTNECKEQKILGNKNKNEMQILKTIAWDDGLIKRAAIFFFCVRYGRSLSLFMMRQHLSRRLNKKNGEKRRKKSSNSSRRERKKERNCTPELWMLHMGFGTIMCTPFVACIEIKWCERFLCAEQEWHKSYH